VNGYPVVPAVFILAAAWVTGTELVDRPGRIGVGLLLLGLSVPAYLLWKRKRR
jgi:hypothetical protein